VPPFQQECLFQLEDWGGLLQEVEEEWENRWQLYLQKVVVLVGAVL